jgi:transposase
VNTAAMSIILAEVARRHRCEFVLVVIDQAGGHVADDLVVPDNMRFLCLPHGSQELNPAEHVWEALRERCSPIMYSKILTPMKT